MGNNQIYINIKIDRDTHEVIKGIAKSYHMTQSELINNICNEFIEDFKAKALEIATEELKKTAP